MEILLTLPGFILAIITMIRYEHKINSNSSKIGKNKVHFYVARDKCGKLWLYLNKPIRFNEDIWLPCKQGCSLCIGEVFKNIGLNEADYKDLKWEDEPVEVFLNLED